MKIRLPFNHIHIQFPQKVKPRFESAIAQTRILFNTITAHITSKLKLYFRSAITQGSTLLALLGTYIHTPNQTVALIIGTLFLLLGLFGLIFHPLHGNLLGFDVDLPGNLIHLLTGIGAIAVATVRERPGLARRYNQIFGFFYLVLGILGTLPFLYFNGSLLYLLCSNDLLTLFHFITGFSWVFLSFFLSEPQPRIPTHEYFWPGDMGDIK